LIKKKNKRKYLHSERERWKLNKSKVNKNGIID